MNKILIRYNEIYLKGNNRGHFERLLQDNIARSIGDIPCTVKRIRGRYLAEGYSALDEDAITSRIRKVVGVYSLSIAKVCKNDIVEICELANSFAKDSGSFRISAKRAEKRFPMDSMEMSRHIGGYILVRHPDLKVDLFSPDININVEVREDGYTYVYCGEIMGQGGLPVGCSGSGLLMLSGGIDSPVAGYMMAKRGMAIEGLHFHSYPYTSDLAKEKVIRLAKIVKEYSLDFKLHVVSFTEIQEEIHKNCPSEFMIILMRRFMMRIANSVAKNCGHQAIITGENLGQVASQTIESMSVTNAIAKYPVLRPLVGFDKIDIIALAKKIETYDTSILPYEDCCTIFLPKKPIIKPKLEQIEKQEERLDIQGLVARAVSGIETITI